jgi:hypothetical protein
MHHVEVAFGFFSYLIDWLVFRGGDNVNYGPIAG